MLLIVVTQHYHSLSEPSFDHLQGKGYIMIPTVREVRITLIIHSFNKSLLSYVPGAEALEIQE